MQIKSTVLCLLFSLSIYSSFAQISLDKIEYDNGYGKLTEIYFYYDNGLISAIDSYYGEDSSYMNISYDGDLIKSIEYLSNDDYFTFNLELIYTDGVLDSALYNEDILYDLSYNENSQLVNLEKFKAIDNTLFKSRSKEFDYEGEQLKKRKVYDYFSTVEGDWDSATNSFTLGLDNLPLQIYSTYSSGHGYSKTFYVYENDELERLEKKAFNGGDEIWNHFDYIPSYHVEYHYDEILHPMELFDLLRNLGLYGKTEFFDSEDQFFDGNLVTQVDIVDQLYGEYKKINYYYSDPSIVVSNESLESIDEITFYPNPTYNTIEFDGLQGLERLNIYDLNGNLMMKQELTSNSLNLETIPTGYYLMKIIDDQGRIQIFPIIKL